MCFGYDVFLTTSFARSYVDPEATSRSRGLAAQRSSLNDQKKSQRMTPLLALDLWFRKLTLTGTDHPPWLRNQSRLEKLAH